MVSQGSNPQSRQAINRSATYLSLLGERLLEGAFTFFREKRRTDPRFLQSPLPSQKNPGRETEDLRMLKRDVLAFLGSRKYSPRRSQGKIVPVRTKLAAQISACSKFTREGRNAAFAKLRMLVEVPNLFGVIPTTHAFLTISSGNPNR